MPANNQLRLAQKYDIKAFAEKYAELGDGPKALKELIPVPPEGKDQSWYNTTAFKLRQTNEFQEYVVDIYSKKAALEYADCLPLASAKVKEFLMADYSGNAKGQKAQAEIAAKILQDANIALGGSKFKQPVIENRNELLDELSNLILADKGLIEQIIGRAASVVDGSSARVVNGEADQRGEVLPAVPETDGVSERGEDEKATDVPGGEPLPPRQL